MSSFVNDFFDPLEDLAMRRQKNVSSQLQRFALTMTLLTLALVTTLFSDSLVAQAPKKSKEPRAAEPVMEPESNPYEAFVPKGAKNPSPSMKARLEKYVSELDAAPRNQVKTLAEQGAEFDAALPESQRLSLARAANVELKNPDAAQIGPDGKILLKVEFARNTTPPERLILSRSSCVLTTADSSGRRSAPLPAIWSRFCCRIGFRRIQARDRTAMDITSGIRPTYTRTGCT